jgi:hypothetical protein
MRKWFQGALVLSLLAATPAVARAAIIVEGSFGKGSKVSPSPTHATPTNFMVAPGLAIPFVHLQLGLVWDLPDVEPKQHNLELRPMITIAPPILPLYGRVVFAVTNLVHDKTTIAYGAALGLSLGLGPIGVFAEAGVLPRSSDSKINWVIEGRLGASLTF